MSDPRLSAEERLLICCADMRCAGQVDHEARSLLARDLNWDFLFDMAKRHGAAPLLYSLIERSGAGGRVRSGMLKKIEGMYHANRVKNTEVEKQLIHILECFRATEIECIVLKGVFVSRTIYPDRALRSIGDIDLLIHFNDLSRVDAALDQAGYAFASDSLAPGFYHKIHFHKLYYGKDRFSRVPVEVHWNVQDQYNVLRINIDAIWARAIRWEIDGARCLGMAPVDLLAYLCFHADKHGCYSKYIVDYSLTGPKTILDNHHLVKLSWYAEILKLIDLYDSELDWPLFVMNCKNWGIDHEVYATLTLINRTFGVSVAAGALAELGPPRTREYLVKLYPRLLAERPPRLSPSGFCGAGHGSKFARAGRLLKFRPARFLDIITYLFPDLETLSRRYGTSPPLLYLFYIMHVVRVSCRSVMCLGVLVYYVIRKHLVK